MKRSEAVKQLKYWLFGNSDNPQHQDEAEALLKKIETMGLKPPIDTDGFYKWEDENDYCGAV